MKKRVLFTLEAVVLIVAMTLTFYVRHRFLIEKSANDLLREELNEVQENVDSSNREIDSLTKDISELRDAKEDEIREYEEWVNRKEKLESLLGY